MKKQGYVAFDLGAESGRAMLATIDKDRIHIQETHRFLNIPQRLPSGLHWNLLDLWGNLVQGLRKSGQAAATENMQLVSLGVDTWGVDFGLVGKSGQLLGLPYAYRDERNAPAMKKALKKLGEKKVYDATGLQFMAFNSLFQLLAQHESEPSSVDQAKRLLFMPDLLHYFFSGVMANEATIASTSQMIDPRNGKWNKPLVESLGIPTHLLGKIVPAGTRIGTLLDAVAKEAQVNAMDVIVPGSHDTASAVAAVPVDDELVASGNWAYLSSGTWSLMGAEIDKPIVTDEARKLSFTHERGVGNKIRFLKNIAGLWLVQECRRHWLNHGQEFDYATLTKLAAESQPFRTLVDPNHASFSSPGDMPVKIAAFAKATKQPVPQTTGQFVRCCLESLAMEYRRTLEALQTLLNREIDVLHIVGGGGRNALLNQLTADAIGRPVIVGPYEGTAIGNALTQAMGRGQVKDLFHLRRIVRNTEQPAIFRPQGDDAVEIHYKRFVDMVEK